MEKVSWSWRGEAGELEPESWKVGARRRVELLLENWSWKAGTGEIKKSGAGETKKEDWSCSWRVVDGEPELERGNSRVGTGELRGLELLQESCGGWSWKAGKKSGSWRVGG